MNTADDDDLDDDDDDGNTKARRREGARRVPATGGGGIGMRFVGELLPQRHRDTEGGTEMRWWGVER
jgi:hypothetical protein